MAVTEEMRETEGMPGQEMTVEAMMVEPGVAVAMVGAEVVEATGEGIHTFQGQ